MASACSWGGGVAGGVRPGPPGRWAAAPRPWPHSPRLGPVASRWAHGAEARGQGGRQAFTVPPPLGRPARPGCACMRDQPRPSGRLAWFPVWRELVAMVRGAWASRRWQRKELRWPRRGGCLAPLSRSSAWSRRMCTATSSFRAPAGSGSPSPAEVRGRSPGRAGGGQPRQLSLNPTPVQPGGQPCRPHGPCAGARPARPRHALQLHQVRLEGLRPLRREAVCCRPGFFLTRSFLRSIWAGPLQMNGLALYTEPPHRPPPRQPRGQPRGASSAACRRPASPTGCQPLASACSGQVQTSAWSRVSGVTVS